MRKLAPAFATANSETKDQAAAAVAAAKGKDYSKAARALGVIVDRAGFSEEQKQALIFTLTEIRRKVSEASPPDRDLLDRIDRLTLRLTD